MAHYRRIQRGARASLVNKHIPRKLANKQADDGATAALHRLAILSPREYEVAISIASGKSQATIAEEMHVSNKTIQTHRERALRRLGLTSNVQLAILAYCAGLVACP